MIVDAHTHLPGPPGVSSPFFDGWQANIRRLLPPGLEAGQRDRIAARCRVDRSDPHGDAHVAQMDAAGIDLSVCLAVDWALAFPRHALPIDEVFAAHAALRARHPGRFVIFAGIDPRRGRAGVELFERALGELGFRGLKLYPPCGFSPADPQLDPYYALCAQAQVPVVVHTGPSSPSLSSRYARPAEVEEAAHRFPSVHFVLAHGAVVHVEEAALLAEYRPNVYVDTAGFQVAARRGEWNASLALYKRRGILRKMVFGTDWPLHAQAGSLEYLVRLLAGEPRLLTDTELQWIFEQNLREIMRFQ